MRDRLIAFATWLEGRRPRRWETVTWGSLIALLLLGQVAYRLMDGIGEGWPSRIGLATGVRETSDLLAWFATPLAILLLPLLTLPASWTRRAGAVALALLGWVGLVGFAGPLAWRVTTEWARAELILGYAMHAPPHTWTWWERLRACTAEVAPSGSQLDATLVQACEASLQGAAVVLLGVVLLLSVALLRPPPRVPWWLALPLAAASFAVAWRSAGMYLVEGLVPAAAWVAQLLIPVTLLGASAWLHAWAGRARGRSSGPARRPAGVVTTAGLLLIALVAVSPASYGRLFSRPGPVGRPAPESRLAVVGDDGTRLPVRGAGEVTLLTYWASWCGPCRAELDWLSGLLPRLEGRGLRVLAVNVGESDSTVLEFWPGERPFPPLRATGELLDDLPSGLPASYLIDRAGIVRFAHRGFAAGRTAEYEAEIEELLGEPVPP